MNFWKVWISDRGMLLVQAMFWVVYAMILYVRNVWMPEVEHKYTFWHVLGMLAIIICLFYAMAWIFWILGHSTKKTKWIMATAGLLIAFLPLLGMLFYYVFPVRFNLWFFDPEQLPSIGMFIYRVVQKYFHFGVEAALLVSRYIIQDRAHENARLSEQNHALHIRFITGVINPHFLANSLQALRTGIDQVDATLARTMDKLADMLRYGIDHAKKLTLTVPIADELTHARNYLDILSYRFQRDFTGCLRTTGDLSAWELPPITLTTLLENVFAHGAIKRVAGRPFDLTLQGKTSELTITCRNTIRARHYQRATSTGIGLDTTRQRLLAAFPHRVVMNAEAQQDEFFVQIIIKQNHETSS